MSKNIEINVSISDLPLFASYDDLFAKLKNSGANGVELVTGLKSRWNFREVKKVSEQYSLPIQSIHQPPWSMFNIVFDEGFIHAALETGARVMVFHPLPNFSLLARQQNNRKQQLHIMQKAKRRQFIIPYHQR